MTHITHRRLGTRVQGFEAELSLAPMRWAGAEPERRSFPSGAFAFCVAALLCAGWWATGAELLVASARREGGRILACQYLVGKRVVERQFLHPSQGTGAQACPLVRFN